MPADARVGGATIAVVDDGEGMISKGLEQMWQICTSQKRTLNATSLNLRDDFSITFYCEALIPAKADRRRFSRWNIGKDIVKVPKSAPLSVGLDASAIGGGGNPDGAAYAHLGASEDGNARRYRVTLEAKSAESDGKTVTAKTVGVSGVHRKKLQADHVVVLGASFPTRPTKGVAAALVDEIADDRAITPGKPPREPFKDILETIWSEQRDDPDAVAKYSTLRGALKNRPKQVRKTEDERRQLYRTMSAMASALTMTLQDSVELEVPRSRSSRISKATNDYSDD